MPVSRAILRLLCQRALALLDFGVAHRRTALILAFVVPSLAVIGTERMIGHQKASRIAEATHMVQGIRVAQETYKAETDHYLNVSNALAANDTNHFALYPHK